MDLVILLLVVIRKEAPNGRVGNQIVHHSQLGARLAAEWLSHEVELLVVEGELVFEVGYCFGVLGDTCFGSRGDRFDWCVADNRNRDQCASCLGFNIRVIRICFAGVDVEEWCF